MIYKFNLSDNFVLFCIEKMSVKKLSPVLLLSQILMKLQWLSHTEEVITFFMITEVKFPLVDAKIRKISSCLVIF